MQPVGLAQADEPSADGSGAERQAYGARAVVPGPIAATNREDPTASGTTIRAQDRGRALEDVGEAMIEVPGVRVQNLGGAGAFSGVSLRGAELDHTAVLLGVIPITTADDAAFDLSGVPLSAFEGIEVYRGGAPAWYTEGAIGGLVRFNPRTAKDDRLEVSVGLGSFGRKEARATTTAIGRSALRPTFLGHVRLLGTDNDYTYTADRATRFVPEDDVEVRQRNADITAYDGLIHGSADVLGGRLSMLLVGHGRQQGVAGAFAIRATRVRRKLVRTLAGVSYEHDAYDHDGERRHRLQFVASGSHQQHSLTDLIGELGPGNLVDSDDLWQRGFVRLAGGVRLLPFFEPTVVVALQRDAYRPRNEVSTDLRELPSGRTTASATIEARFYGRLLDTRVELRPSMRQAWSQTQVFFDPGREVDKADEQQSNHAATYRIAGALEPAPGVTVSASVASGVRLPSIGELFGDRIFQEANPHLLPERSWSIDVATVLRGRAGELSGTLETRGFSLMIDDLILYERTPRKTFRPKNGAFGDILGLEIGANLRFGRHLSLVSATTLMRSRNQLDRNLPMRPHLQLLLRAQLDVFPGVPERLSTFLEAHHVDFVYVGEKNIGNPLPARTLLSLGTAANFLAGRLTIEARVHNLLDAQPSDILSRPLPGRDFRFAITVSQPLR